jgi:hypothetical protein
VINFIVVLRVQFHWIVAMNMHVTFQFSVYIIAIACLQPKNVILFSSACAEYEFLSVAELVGCRT